jgi:DNA-binding MarR family transcriptional regulator
MSGETTRPDGATDRQHAINVALRAHQVFGEALGREFYSVPALDMLFDLYLLGNRKPRSLTSLCGASRAPVRTALRTINRMVDRGLLVRMPDSRDARRVNVALTQEAIAFMDGLFNALATILA